MQDKLNKFYIKSLILIFAGVVSVFAFAPFNKTLVMVFAVLILLFVLENSTLLGKRRYFTLGYVFGLAYFNTQLYWAFYSLYVVIGTISDIT